MQKDQASHSAYTVVDASTVGGEPADNQILKQGTSH